MNTLFDGIRLSNFDSSAHSVLCAFHFIFARCLDHFELLCLGYLHRSCGNCYGLTFYLLLGMGNSPLRFYLFIAEFSRSVWVQMESVQVFDLRLFSKRLN